MMEVNVANFSPSDPLRLLLISEDEGLRDVITAALRGRLAYFRLFWVAQPELAVTRVLDLLPHLIFVDDALGGASPAQLVKQLVLSAPASPILVLVAESAVATARPAIVAGARSFVTKPINEADFASNLREILAQQGAAPLREDGHAAQAAALGRIITFVAPKGGTGRTSTAVNFSIALQQASKRSLVVVDADFAAPSVDVALNLRDDHDLTDLLPRLAQFDQELAAGILAQHASGIRVLLAPPPADMDSPITVPQVQQLLAQLKRMYGWVVVDLGLPLDETAFAFLDAADRIVMTLLPEMTGLRNTRLMLNQFRGRGYAGDKVYLVLNRATMPSGVAKSDIEKRLNVRIAHSLPDDQALASYSINRGVPYMLGKGRSALAKAVRDLADHLIYDLAPPAQSSAKAIQAEAGRGALFGRFGKREVLEPAQQPAAQQPTRTQTAKK
jgi:pilus assembly protein CpaE